MVVNAAITPGEEVFNTYGARLSNAELLVRYGFMLDANDNDILTWTIEEIWDAAGAALADSEPRRWDNEAGYGVCMEILRDWQYDAGWAGSELVIDTELDENSNPLYMTADGVLSHKLWLAIALATLQRQDTNLKAAQTRQLLRGMAWAQTQLERGQTMTRSEVIDEDAYRVRAHAPDGAHPSFNADIEIVKKIKLYKPPSQSQLCWRLVTRNRYFGATRVRLLR
jgi:N-lysine methyltransferase SETD6